MKRTVRLNDNQCNAMYELCVREGPAWNDVRRAIERALRALKPSRKAPAGWAHFESVAMAALRDENATLSQYIADLEAALSVVSEDADRMRAERDLALALARSAELSLRGPV
jgi:hypothetical protein